MNHCCGHKWGPHYYSLLCFQAQQKLGAMRVEGNRVKSALEKEIKAHADAVLRAKQADKQIQVSPVASSSLQC